MVVLLYVACEVAEIKQREVIHQLVNRVALFLAEDLVFSDEVALFQFLKGADEDGVVVEASVFEEFLACHSGLFGRQGGDNADVGRGLLKQRVVQGLKFVGEATVFAEKQAVDVLRKTLAAPQEEPKKKSFGKIIGSIAQIIFYGALLAWIIWKLVD